MIPMNFDQLTKSGQLYASPPDGVYEAVTAKLARCQNLLYDFNHTRFTELDRRKALLRELFAETKGDFTWNRPCMPTGAAMCTSAGTSTPIST